MGYAVGCIFALMLLISPAAADGLTKKQLIGCWGYDDSTGMRLDALTFCFTEDHHANYVVVDGNDGWDGSKMWVLKPGGVLKLGDDDCQFAPGTSENFFAFTNCFPGKKFMHRCSKLDKSKTTCAK